MPNAWIVRAGGDAELSDLFLAGCYVSVGYGITSDVTSLETRAEFREACGRASPNDKWSTVSSSGDSLHRFLKEMSVGDVVLMPIDRAVVRFGILVNDAPYFVKRYSDGDTHCIRRRVYWAADSILRADCSEELQRTLDAQGTVFSLQRHSAEIFSLIGYSAQGASG